MGLCGDTRIAFRWMHMYLNSLIIMLEDALKGKFISEIENKVVVLTLVYF